MLGSAVVRKRYACTCVYVCREWFPLACGGRQAGDDPLSVTLVFGFECTWCAPRQLHWKGGLVEGVGNEWDMSC